MEITSSCLGVWSWYEYVAFPTVTEVTCVFRNNIIKNNIFHFDDK